MFSIALLTTLTLGVLTTLTTTTPMPQQITPNLNVPDGYQVGFATVSPQSYLFPFPTSPISLGLNPFVSSNVELTFIATYSKTGNPPANKAPAQLAAMSAVLRPLSSPPPPDRLRCLLVSTRRPWWDSDLTIARFAGRVIVSCRPARRIVRPAILVAR